MIATVLKTLYVLRRYRTVGGRLCSAGSSSCCCWAALLMAIDLLPGGPIGGLLVLLLPLALLAGQRLAAGHRPLPA